MGRRHMPTGNSQGRFSRMASGKRASMREGPLAALFRRTEEESTEPGKEGRPDAREEAPEREPAPEAGSQRPPEPATAAAREREEGTAEREPSAAAPTEATPERAAIPTPRARLRHALSADIPDHVLDPSTAAPRASSVPEAPP